MPRIQQNELWIYACTIQKIKANTDVNRYKVSKNSPHINEIAFNKLKHERPFISFQK